uniref:Transcription initiation factor IIF subunit alpha n=1 Tax=Soboliphyme baturini TaxID=241478 RepID=A0A183J694_9BILA
LLHSVLIPINQEYFEFVVRVPVRNDKKKLYIFKFNGSLCVDISQWSNVSLDRENNADVYLEEDTTPKFGAGSVFGQQMRNDARRKKLGYTTTQYRRCDQPWLLTVSGKQEKKYRGLREGGISQNADYWIFIKNGDNVFDAYIIDEWYNFQPIARYKTLDIDEAEERFLKYVDNANMILFSFQLIKVLIAYRKRNKRVTVRPAIHSRSVCFLNARCSQYREILVERNRKDGPAFGTFSFLQVKRVVL